MERLQTEQDYILALEKLEKLFDSKPSTEGLELEKLVKLIEEWEDKNYPL